ncbi:hypothetical protein [Microbaculum marinum]|uniref:Yip1 domain-containing protein n=1 Tax=Microbaculum marinum TaxID=1764581 RepID=A0AAW9RPJ2_9HYPH
MLDADDVQRGLSAAWQLFLGKRDAIRKFDTSFDGFWRSFAAVILVLPIYVLYVGAERRMIIAELPLDATFAELTFALTRLVALVLDWVAFPIVAFLLARPLGFAGRYVRLIVAFNWGGPIVSVIVALPAILYAFGIIPQFAASLLLFLALVLAVRFRFITAKAALDCGFGLAAGLVALEFLLSLVLGEALTRLAGV